MAPLAVIRCVEQRVGGVRWVRTAAVCLAAVRPAVLALAASGSEAKFNGLSLAPLMVPDVRAAFVGAIAPALRRVLYVTA